MTDATHFIVWRQHPTTHKRSIVAVVDSRDEADTQALSPWKWFPEATEWHVKIYEHARAHGRTWVAFNRRITVEEVDRICDLVRADQLQEPAAVEPCTARVAEAIRNGETDIDAFVEREDGVTDLIANATDLANFCDSDVCNQEKIDRVAMYLNGLIADEEDKRDTRESELFETWDDGCTTPYIAMNSVALARLIRLVQSEGKR